MSKWISLIGIPLALLYGLYGIATRDQRLQTQTLTEAQSDQQ